jgi:FAD-dependent oxidoreductase family protein
VNPLIDVFADGWRAGVDALLAEVTALVASLGGTISGEHGDGRLRTPLLPRVWDRTSLENFAVVKRAFDPDDLLNPGVKLGNSAGIGPIKYDPALPRLPAAAARALDHVDRARDYTASRLDLIAGP